MDKKVIVIGAGFGGLGSAILLARAGYDVTVVEKNDKVGGRANLLEKDGYRRDMGPSRYLMPDAFDRYFTAIGRKVSDYLDLQKLEPSYRVFFKDPSSASSGGTKDLVASSNEDGYDRLSNTTSLINSGSTLSIEQKSKLFGEVFAGEPWFTRTTEEQNQRIISKITEQDGFVEGHSFVGDNYVGGYYGCKVNGVPFEFENIIDSVGFIELCKSVHDSCDEDTIWNLWNCFVNLDYQKQGIGSDLLQHFEQESQLLGAKFSVLSTHIDGFQKLRYEKNGYQIFWETENFGHKLVFMIKKLDSSLHSEGQGVEGQVAKYLDLYADVDKAASTFEGIEQGSGDKLKAYLKSAAYQYGIAMEKFVFKNFDSIWDFMTPQLAIEGMQLNVFTKLYNYVSRYVKNENLKKLLMYPSVFLGTSPYETPALFNIMSHVDFNQGVFYPQGGIHEIPQALYQIALEEGVKFEFNAEVEKIMVENKKVTGLVIARSETTKQSSNKDNTISTQHKNALKSVIDVCIENGINYQLTGGVAANIYGSNRKLNDIDIDVESLDDIAILKSYFSDNVRSYEISPNYEKFIIDGLLLIEIDGVQIEICDLDKNSARQYCPNGLDYTTCDIGDLVVNVVQESILIENKKYLSREQDIVDIQNLSNTSIVKADIIISNADMRHTETQLLDVSQQTYPASYWDKQVISPSGFILYLGVDGELPQLKHHTLVFSDDWKGGFDQIFADPQRPQDPNYYICNPSKTDPTVAPTGKENLFVLVPIAPGLDSTPESLEAYRDHIIADIAHNCGIPDLADRIEVSQIFSIPQFEQYYNAYKGTALGLAHTFFQSAVRRPQNYSKKVKGLYYAGGYTTPGIGMPMCLISAMMVADRVEKNK